MNLEEPVKEKIQTSIQKIQTSIQFKNEIMIFSL